MKNTMLLLLLIGLSFSCAKDDGQGNENEINKVALLKVDFITNVFEGGTEMEFPFGPGFTISSIYKAPGDFGSVQLYYEEFSKKIFDGTIIWMGKGEVSYPEIFKQPDDFNMLSNTLPLPDIDQFDTVMYDSHAYYPEMINYSEIWKSIGNLELLSKYRNTNPDGKINLFLYTPSVGIGDPADWDWYVILKN